MVRIEQRVSHDGIGVPTARDVVSPRYQEARERERVRMLLQETELTGYDVKSYLTSTLRAAGYKDSDRSRLFESGAYKPSMRDRLVGRDGAFLDLLDPSFVADSIIGRAESYQAAILDARHLMPEMEASQETILGKRLTEEERNRFAGVMVEQDLGDSQWKYTFVPMEILMGEIEWLEEEISGQVRSYRSPGMKKRDPVGSILGVHQVLETHRRSSVWSYFLYPFIGKITDGQKSHFHMEFDKRTKAYRAKKAHEQETRGKDSDLWTEFSGDRLALYYRAGSYTEGVPFEWFIGPDQRFTERGLSGRQQIRDFLRSVLVDKRQVIINGRRIFRPSFPELDTFLGIEGTDTLPAWFVNLLPQPVIVSGSAGEVLRPEDWVREEAGMVEAYRAISVREALKVPPHPSVSAILERYQGFWPGSFGRKALFPKRLDYLLQTLRRSDWDELHPRTRR